MLTKILSKIRFELKSLVHRPLKVGMITTQYPEKSGTTKGVAIHVHNLSECLAKLGCEVHIFTVGKKETTSTEYLGDGKRIVHKINTDIGFRNKDFMVEKRLSRMIFDTKIINEVMKESAKEKFDIIHSHITMTGALMSKYFANTKWVHTFHSLEKNSLEFMSKEEKKYQKISRWMEDIANYADSLITVSERLKEEVSEEYSIPKEKIFAINNGVNLELFQPTEEIREKNILYVGRFSSEKGIDLLIDIIKETLKEDNKLKFTIVARPYEKMPSAMEKTQGELEQLAEKYPENVFWIKDILTPESLKKLYNQSIIYIQPSRYDSFPTTVLEAMACGNAVICSSKGGMPEMVDNAGSIVDLDKKAFSSEILKLVKDYRLRERYSRRALKRVELFSWEDIAQKTLLVYKKIIGILKKGEDKYGITQT